MDEIHPIRACRERHSPPLSKADLARKLDVSRNTVHRWETGRRNPSREQLRAIEERLGIPPADILAFERKLEAAIPDDLSIPDFLVRSA